MAETGLERGDAWRHTGRSLRPSPPGRPVRCSHRHAHHGCQCDGGRAGWAPTVGDPDRAHADDDRGRSGLWRLRHAATARPLSCRDRSGSTWRRRGAGRLFASTFATVEAGGAALVAHRPRGMGCLIQVQSGMNGPPSKPRRVDADQWTKSAKAAGRWFGWPLLEVSAHSRLTQIKVPYVEES